VESTPRDPGTGGFQRYCRDDRIDGEGTVTRAPAAEILLVSSVQVGVLDELAAALQTQPAMRARVVSALSDERWRASRGGGRAARISARLAGLLFPLTVRLGRSSAEQIVVATTNPFWLPSVLALRRVHPLVVLVYDVYPDALDARWDVPGWIRRVVMSVVGFGLRRSDAVVTLGEGVARVLTERHRLNMPVVVIPTGADPARFVGRSVTDLSCPDPGERILVSYVGNTGSVHDGRTAGLALAEVLRRHDDVRAIVATRGDRADEFTDPLRDVDGVTISSDLDDAAYCATLARTDIALVTLGTRAGIASVPSKVYAALAAGCAILAIAPADSDLAALVTASGAGIVVDPGDVAAAIEALEALAGDAARRRAHAASARRAAERFTPAAIAKDWAEVLTPLLRD
jgi:glycosyltransferase involved in cell wall biosynthesis